MCIGGRCVIAYYVSFMIRNSLSAAYQFDIMSLAYAIAGTGYLTSALGYDFLLFHIEAREQTLENHSDDNQFFSPIHNYFGKSAVVSD